MFEMPPWLNGSIVESGYHFRVIVGGTVTAQ